MTNHISAPVVIVSILSLMACANLPADAQEQITDAAVPIIDSDAALSDLRALSANFMDGRETGTRGAAIARGYLTERFAQVGLQPYESEDFTHTFSFTPRGGSEVREGINLVGFIEGREDGPVMVITAHYDHLGNCGGEVCNGADDNASGVAAMLAIADALQGQPPRHDIYFAALDAEEVGLRGARALVADGQIPIERVALNINLDMLAINDENELAAAGAYHFPFLSERIDRAGATAPTQLIQGYDSDQWGPNGDWTNSSDHAAFHHAGIPWIYYGVDFHEHYHQPTDEYEVIDRDFFVSNAQTVMNAVVLFDNELEGVVSDLADMQANTPEPLGQTEDGSMRKPGME